MRKEFYLRIWDGPFQAKIVGHPPCVSLFLSFCRRSMKTLSLNCSSSCVSNFPACFMVEVSKEHEISYINCESKIMVLFVLWQYKTYIVFFFFFSIRIEVKDKFEHLCCAFSLPKGTAEQPVSWQTPIYKELLNCTTQVPKMLVLCFHAYMNIWMKNKPVVQMETLGGYRKT